MIGNRGYTIRNDNGTQVEASRKRLIKYRYTIWNNNGSQTLARHKSVIVNFRHIVWNNDRGQQLTTSKCISTYIRYNTWDSDRCQVSTVIESIITDEWQTSEVLQLVKRRNHFVSPEHLAKILYSRRLFH